DGCGYMKIAKELNSGNVPCPSEYKRIQGSKFKTNGGRQTSKIWNDSVIRQILTNRVYIGDLVQGKTTTISYKNKKRKHVPEADYIVAEHTHDAIVDSAVWEAVSSMMENRKRAEKTTGERHIFAGKIVCAECGSCMWKMSYRLKDGRYAYLKCKATKCSDFICDNKQSIRFDAVLLAVQTELKKLFKQHFDLKKVDKNTLLFSKKTENSDTRKQIEDRILKQNLNIKQLYKDKLDGIIDYEIYCSIYKDIKAELAFLQNQLSEMKQSKQIDTSALSKRMEAFSDRYVPDAYAVSCLIDKIEIGKPQGDSRTITIFWKL
ncbi:MAG: recombinase family protein, partial [Clostridia bacterium]|nr:recombinase family protein [Clostridia bacterium]